MVEEILIRIKKMFQSEKGTYSNLEKTTKNITIILGNIKEEKEQQQDRAGKKLYKIARDFYLYI